MNNNKKDNSSLPGCEGEHKMQEKLGTKEKAKEFYNKQMLDFLAPQMQDFIKKQEMVFISTSDKNGECDCSFRSGIAGFVQVLDEKRVIYAEYKGNGVMASMGNISENPHIGMLFLDFLEDKIGLHLNGKATVLDTKNLNIHLDNSSIQKLKKLEASLEQKHISWVLVYVEEAYVHCSKNIPLFKKNSGLYENSKSHPTDYFKLNN